MKRKQITLKDIIVILVSAIFTFGSAYIMSEQILESFKPLWFTIFFIGFAVMMFIIVSLMNLKYLGKRFIINS